MNSMETPVLEPILAERSLEYHDPDRGCQRVRVLLGMPRECADEENWYCPFQIVGIGLEPVRAIYGIDAFQCLQLVMKVIGATLYSLSAQGSRLSWLDGPVGDFGFPWE